ncbi:MAG TPA: magnesium/cobalt transporter CorA [Steroidobacteraceae bacterium]|jgi:magnesium transporter|nr:magnesium/cobalt transporter CorA [Steroidobacteraceae bacterium]
MLISSVVYQNGRKLADIEPQDIHRYLAQPDCFVWVALLEPDAATLELMQAEFDLHPLAVEDARHGHQRPKIEEYGDVLFVVLHMIETGETELRVGEVDVFVGRNFILSVRTGVEKGFRDVRARAEREPELLRRGPGYVLYALMDAVVDRYFPILQTIEVDLERIEEEIFAATSPRANIEALYVLKQRLMAFRHAVGPLLESLGNITGARVPGVCGGMQEYFRDIADHLQRLNQTIESIRDTASTAISVNLSMITLQESENMKRLAAYAALIAVPTLIVGIYGMNFDYMPELRWHYGYALVWGLMAAIDGYIFYRLRKARWL